MSPRSVNSPVSQPLVALESLLDRNAFFEDGFGFGQTLLSEIDQPQALIVAGNARQIAEFCANVQALLEVGLSLLRFVLLECQLSQVAAFFSPIGPIPRRCVELLSADVQLLGLCDFSLELGDKASIAIVDGQTLVIAALAIYRKGCIEILNRLVHPPMT